MKPPIITVRIYAREYTAVKPPTRPKIVPGSTYKVTEYARDGQEPLYFAKAGNKREIMFRNAVDAYKYLDAHLKVLKK